MPGGAGIPGAGRWNETLDLSIRAKGSNGGRIVKLLIALIVFAGCLTVQRLALHRRAFGRSLFITAMGFLTSVIVGISPYPPARYVSQGLFWATWVFIGFMTVVSILRLRHRH